MADVTSPGPGSAEIPVQPTAAYKDREAWFTTTPDPWVQIATLEYGSDRTYATTVQRMVAHAEPEQHAAMETKLLQALQHPEISIAGRQFICRMLGMVGSKPCIAIVVPLLDSIQTADFARMALDPLTEPEVDEAYRAALPRLKGAAKAGLIGSIGLRGDGKAVDALTAIALDRSEDEAVRTVAERVVEKLSAKASS